MFVELNLSEYDSAIEPLLLECVLTMATENHESFVFKITGMDCAEEVSTLKREISPLLGGEEHCSVDLLNSKLTVKKTNATLKVEDVICAIEKTGMKASLWEKSSLQLTFYERNTKLILTLIGILFLMLGFLVHGLLHGGISHAFIEGGTGARHHFPWISILFYSISILTGGWFIFPKALFSLKKLRPDMNLLMTVAVLGSIVLGEWLEAGTVTVLFAISLLLESWSVERARRAIQSLLNLAPNEVHVLKPNGQEDMRLAQNVQRGETFIIKPGERIPLDGVILKGVGEVNQAPITGESLPVQKKVGDLVFAGTINGNSTMEILCEKTADDSTLSTIIRLVGEAHAQRAPSEQWVEKFAKFYTPVVMAMAFLVMVIPPLFFSAAWSECVYRALVLLVIACPCALVISTPVSIVAALTAAAKRGVLIKGGKFIEIPAVLRAIAFDKTGTLTKGELKVAKVNPFHEYSETELLEIASSIESQSEHPIAKAIVLDAKLKGITIVPAQHYLAIQGKGATATLKNKSFWLGSHRYLEEKGQENDAVHKQLDELSQGGHTVVVIGNDDHVCGYIALSDTIKPEAKPVIENLHKLGIQHTVMLTGDNQGTAELISSKVGIDHLFAELLPQDKVKKMDELVSKYTFVAMVGDGVNDAPAMARSNLGIAMGVSGSDAAIESADIALMTDDLMKIPWLISHSKRTLAIIRQNIMFSLLVKAMFMLLTFLGHASLWTAIAADTGASLLVVFNGLRLLGDPNTNSIHIKVN